MPKIDTQDRRRDTSRSFILSVTAAHIGCLESARHKFRNEFLVFRSTQVRNGYGLDEKGVDIRVKNFNVRKTSASPGSVQQIMPHLCSLRYNSSLDS
jgi:hypothetical protein